MLSVKEEISHFQVIRACFFPFVRLKDQDPDPFPPLRTFPIHISLIVDMYEVVTH